MPLLLLTLVCRAALEDLSLLGPVFLLLCSLAPGHCQVAEEQLGCRGSVEAPRPSLRRLSLSLSELIFLLLSLSLFSRSPDPSEGALYRALGSLHGLL